MEHQLKKANEILSQNIIKVFFKIRKINKSYGLNSKSRKSQNIITNNFSKDKKINNYNKSDAELVKGMITNVEVFGQKKKIDSNNTIILSNNKVIELTITIEPPNT